MCTISSGNDYNDLSRSGSEELVGNSDHDFTSDSALVGRQDPGGSSPALLSGSQGAYSSHGGNQSFSPAHSLGSQVDYSSRSHLQITNEGTGASSHQVSRSRPTPASNFSALFPAPQAVASITTDHTVFPSYFNQSDVYQQSLPRSSQAGSSRGSPFTTDRYHPYSQSSGSSAPPSLSHSVSSASLSLVGSSPSSRAVSASGFSSPHPSTHSSSATFPVSNFNPSIPTYSQASTQSGPHSLVQSNDQNQARSHRPASANALVLPSYSSAHHRASSYSSALNSASATPYYYNFDGEQEERKPIITGIEHQNRGIESTGKQEQYGNAPRSLAHSSDHLSAQSSQYATTTPGAFGTGIVSYSGQDFVPAKVPITGSRGLLAPLTSQEHRLSIDRQKSWTATRQQQEHQSVYSTSSQLGSSTTPYRATMSDNLYHSNVDLDTLESYDDDDILGNLPQDSGYDGAGRFSMGSASAGGSMSKKDEKLIRRRSSKACDQCRKSKCKCERSGDSESCKSCVMLGTACTYLGPSRKRGPPKGYIDAIESRLHQTEALVGILLALANPERGVFDGDNPVPDERARSLLEDLRNNDPLAREIIERVDRGAYGTKGRKSNPTPGGDAKRSSMRPDSGSGDEKSSGSGGTIKESSRMPSSGPPASIQGRGRMVGLGQEIGSSALANAHPSNEWQDAVVERLKVTVRSRTNNSTSSREAAGQSSQVRSSGEFVERERQRRRVESPSEHQDRAEHANSPFVHSQPGQLQSNGSSDRPNSLTVATSAARFSPLVAAPYSSTAYSSVGPPPSSSSSHSSYGIDSTADEGEHVEGEEGITGGVGQLSINEEAQVRFHGKVSGLHLLGQRMRVDGRNKGGIWHFPKARVWPPVAPKSAMHLARVKEADACERAARAKLPSRDVQEHLLQLYFAHVHPFLPIVHKQTFFQEFRKMHDDLDKPEWSGHENRPTSDRGRTTNSSADSQPESGRSSSADSVLSNQSKETNKVGGDNASPTSEAPRIPTLLLLAMFAIAARYAPVAHGTTASPPQVLLEPSQSAAEMQGTHVKRGDTKTSHPSESQGSTIRTENSDASKSAENNSAVNLETDSELPDPDSGHMWAAGDGFLERAEDLLDRTYASSRPSTCQALILMGYREIGIGAMAQSWLYIGMAVRMAQDLGMHRNSDTWTRDGNPIFSPIEQQLRKRIWYACVIMDKYVSAYIGRPLSIFEADYDTRLPSTDEEELELWSPNETTPNSILSDPVEAVSAPVPAFAPITGRVISCFNESARLSSILAMIMQAIYAVTPMSSRTFEALQLERTLDRWYMDLPDYLRFDTGVRSTAIPPPNVLILHMQYWCVVILLHRPFIPQYLAMHQKRLLRPGSPVDQKAYSAAQKNFNLCVSAANHITSIVSIYQEHFCLKRCPVFLSYYIFTAAIMHMTTMATNATDPQASLGLSKCMDVLKRIEIVWPSAARAWELLHGAKDDLPDYEMPTAIIDRPRKRSADGPIDAVSLGDPSQLHAGRSTSATAPQAYAPAAMNGQRYDPVMDIGDSSRVFSLFNSYSRWSPDALVDVPSGLSTSVLPQQYSTGFIDERASASGHRDLIGLADSSGRISSYWSDYSMGEPSSMLGSMYSLPHLSNAQHHDQQGQHVSQGLQHAPGFTGGPSLFMDDHYTTFNHS